MSTTEHRLEKHTRGRLAANHFVTAVEAMRNALGDLVAMDRCNYDRHVMRTEGAFDRAQEAIDLYDGIN